MAQFNNRPGPNSLQAQVDAARHTSAHPAELQADALLILRNIDRNIARLTNILAPPQLWTPIIFNNLSYLTAPIGINFMPSQNCRLNGGIYNTVIGTVSTSSGASVAVWLNSADPNSQPPDFVFLPGFPSSPLHFTDQTLDQITVANIGTANASGRISFGRY